MTTFNSSFDLEQEKVVKKISFTEVVFPFLLTCLTTDVVGKTFQKGSLKETLYAMSLTVDTLTLVFTFHEYKLDTRIAEVSEMALAMKNSTRSRLTANFGKRTPRDMKKCYIFDIAYI